MGTDAIFDEIRDLIAAPSNRHIEAWKEQGHPVVGYFCPYVPPEILLAAGALPLRLRGVGSDDSSRADAYLSGRLCTYVRHTVSLILESHYGFLDGAVCANTCDHVRRATDVLRKKSDLPYVGFVSVPRSPREDLLGYYRDELATLLDELSAHLGTTVGDDAVQEAVHTLDASRRLLTEINELRLGEQPRLSGAEALEVHVASQVLPPRVFQDLGRRLLEALADREGLASDRARLLLVGAELDEPEFVRAVESQGALVVADRLCWGARSVLDPIGHSDDALDAVARAYFFRPSCARMMGDFPARWQATHDLVERSRADGIVFERVMFCDPWGADLHNLQRRAKEAELPVLALTREYGIVPTGQVRTRVQAFVERIEIARARGGAR